MYTSFYNVSINPPTKKNNSYMHSMPMFCLVELVGDNSRAQVKEGMSDCIYLSLLHLDHSLIVCLAQENYKLPLSLLTACSKLNFNR